MTSGELWKRNKASSNDVFVFLFFSPDAVVDPWLKRLWDLLLRIYPLPNGLEIISDTILPEPRYKIDFIDEDEEVYSGQFLERK